MGTLNKFSLRLFVALMMMSSLACKEKSYSTGIPSDDGGGGGGGGSPVAPPVVSADAPLALKLSSTYDTTDYIYPLTFDVVDTNSLVSIDPQATTCSATDDNTEVDCTITIPEARLYRSSLIFQFSRLQPQCKTLIFEPYYYQASNVDGFLPPGERDLSKTLKCATDPDVGCWGGAATELIPGFPDFDALIYTPDETNPTAVLSNSLKLSSSWSQTPRTNRSNAWAANNMPLAKRGISYGNIADMSGRVDDYVAGSFVDYTFYCEEDWGDEKPYIIHLYIDEENEETGGTATPNDFWSWFDAP
ncbi:MAG: hypothetical protein KDD38_10395 [Bdellovibrionales bacterium]|nr:hypothetical protein [Bdellovibrionales bacterium]